MDTKNKTAQAAAKEQETDTSFLNEYAGEGLDSITQNATATAYLGIVQPGSACVSDDCPAGTWRNSATGKNYGNMVRVVPLAFRTVWNERSSEAPYATIANYAPGSIEVDIKQPAKGQRGFAKMYNKESGNEIKELYVYAIMLPDYPEDGVLYLNLTASSMKACRAWNTQLKGQLLPNGVQAPIFGYSWQLIADLVPNPKQMNTKMGVLRGAVKDAITNKELFLGHVKPVLSLVKSDVAQIGFDTSDEETE